MVKAHFTTTEIINVESCNMLKPNCLMTIPLIFFSMELSMKHFSTSKTDANKKKFTSTFGFWILNYFSLQMVQTPKQQVYAVKFK